jgi:N-acetylmuramoyl-L-alanine amidase
VPDLTEDIDALARTCWAEARGEGPVGMAAVACVIARRAEIGGRYKAKWGTPHPLYGDGSLTSACKKKWQFSCWNPGDPNLPKLLAVTTDDPVFAQAVEIATDAAAGDLRDITSGATHYVARWFYDSAPADHWCKKKPPICEIGSHLFFRNP